MPKRTNYNYFYLDAFLSYIEDKYKIPEKLKEEISEFLSKSIEESIDKERASWLGETLREMKGYYKCLKCGKCLVTYIEHKC